MEQAWNIHRHIYVNAATCCNSCSRLFVSHTSGSHTLYHSIRNLLFKHLWEITAEGIGRIGSQPLVRAKHTCGPMPTTMVVALKGKLLCQRVAQL